MRFLTPYSFNTFLGVETQMAKILKIKKKLFSSFSYAIQYKFLIAEFSVNIYIYKIFLSE